MATHSGAPHAPLVLLIDGNSLAYRAFFALPETIATSTGEPTNALYGLAAMLVKVVVDERPDRVVVAWDPKGPVFRHERYPDYKKGRAATPELLRAQRPHFRPLMEAFGFLNVECTGFEADDVIGTLATQFAERGDSVVVLTGDRDALQLVDERVSVLATGRGVTDTTRYTPDTVCERYGVTPVQMPDFRGLVGDASDNLPGVRGIGEKGASQLISSYGTLEEVLAHASEQTPKRREALERDAEAARLTRDLSVIVRDVPLEIGPAEVAMVRWDDAQKEQLRSAFARWEFESLMSRCDDLFASDTTDVATRSDAGAVSPLTFITLDQVATAFAAGELLGFAADGHHYAITGPGEVVCVGEVDSGDLEALVTRLSGYRIAAYDAKSLPRAYIAAGIRVADDPMIGAYLLEPRRRGYPIADVAASTLGDVAVVSDDVVVQSSVWARALAVTQSARLTADGVENLYRTIELPVAEILGEMENAGILLNAERLHEISERTLIRLEELRHEICALAGEPFDVGSPKQLGHVLFDILGLPASKKGKTGYSTDRQVLTGLIDRHPIIELVLEYRELSKLQSTYLVALPELIGADGRVHTTFNQTVAETGRLSSANPNLQNIPVRTSVGREIRDAFTAAAGCRLVSCDYGQVELRILAHCSGEPTLQRAFREGFDVHVATASEVFGIPITEVDKATRDRAKAVNFGIIYGISDFGLSEQLRISRADARSYIDAYLDRYPKIQEFIRTTIEDATRTGGVTTLFGRRRPIPELNASTQQQRQLGERLAVNTVIQGSAADIIKVAMIRTRDALRDAHLSARMILQIHDELVIEAPEAEVDQVVSIVREAMIGACALDPPLSVEVGVGATWLSAKA